MALSKTRSSWTWNELEQVIRCPICYEVPTGAILQCLKGHHFCMTCTKKMAQCPCCQSSFMGTRNFPLEELISNIPLIQNKILENGEKLINNNIVKVNKRKLSSFVGPVQDRGRFPCLSCYYRYPISRLLTHIRYYHSENLSEVKLKTDFFYQRLETSLEMNNHNVKVIRIDHYGLFFLSLFLRDSGITGCLQMAASHTESQKFIYSLRLNIDNENAHFIGRVRSCREPIRRIAKENDCLLIPPDKKFFFHVIYLPVKRFICFLTIRRTVDP